MLLSQRSRVQHGSKQFRNFLTLGKWKTHGESVVKNHQLDYKLAHEKYIDYGFRVAKLCCFVCLSSTVLLLLFLFAARLNSKVSDLNLNLL